VLTATGTTRTIATSTSVFVAPGLKNNPFSFSPFTLYIEMTDEG
jgi:hypothetical protein